MSAILLGIAEHVVDRSLRGAVKQLLIFQRETAGKIMFMAGKDDVEQLEALPHRGICIIVLAIRTGIADRKVIRSKFPGLTAIFQVLNDPCIDILRSVHPQYIKMGVSYVPRSPLGR